MGYAIPGTVIAIGILIPFGALDNGIDAWMLEHFDIGNWPYFQWYYFLYCSLPIWFVSLPCHLILLSPVLEKSGPQWMKQPKTMGYSGIAVLRHIHLPIMKGSLLTALIIVFC